MAKFDKKTEPVDKLDLRSEWQKQRDRLERVPSDEDDDDELGGADDAPPPPEVDKPKRKLVKRVLSFKVEVPDYDSDDPDATLVGTVVSRVPGGDEYTKIALHIARLCNGLPWESIAPSDRRRFSYLAGCEYQIQDGPAWLRKRLYDDGDFLSTVYGRLVEHVITFRLRGRDLAPGESPSGLAVGVAVGPLVDLPSALQRRGS